MRKIDKNIAKELTEENFNFLNKVFLTCEKSGEFTSGELDILNGMALIYTETFMVEKVQEIAEITGIDNDDILEQLEFRRK